MDKLFSGRRRPEQKPPDCVSRYLVVKHSWRGKYKRILCITPTAIHTQNPEGRLVLTNTYVFAGAGEADVESVTLGADDAESFVLSARQDKRVRAVVVAALLLCWVDLLHWQCVGGAVLIWPAAGGGSAGSNGRGAR